MRGTLKNFRSAQAKYGVIVDEICIKENLFQATLIQIHTLTPTSTHINIYARAHTYIGQRSNFRSHVTPSIVARLDARPRRSCLV